MASTAPRLAIQRTESTGVSVELLLYVAVFGIAVFLRSIKLGATSLSGFEVLPALAARNFPSSYPPSSLNSSPLVIGVTALSFSLFGASDASARIAPMLAGLALVASPLLFRRYVGRVPTLIACLLLAISPGAVEASRQVNGIALSVLAFIIGCAALVMYMRHTKPLPVLWSGIAFGIAFGSDIHAILLVVAVVLGGLFAYLTDDEGRLEGLGLSSLLPEFPWKLFASGFIGTLMILSTSFFLSPGGLGATANQMGVLVVGLLRRIPGTPWLGFVLGIYELNIVAFGTAGIWLCSQSGSAWQRFLAGAGFASVTLTLIFPGLLPLDALWTILPLAVLSAQTIGALFTMHDRAPSWAAWLHAGGIIAFAGMIFASLSQYLRNPKLTPLGVVMGNPDAGIPIDLVLTVVWLVLLIILWLTVASMWEPRTAWKGLGLGSLVISLAVTLGQSASLATVRADSPFELYNLEPAQPGLRVMVDTIEDIGNLAVGSPQEASITVQGSSVGNLGWALRDFHNVDFVERADPTIDTVMVITPVQGADPALGSSYVGQDRVIMQGWQPNGLSMLDFGKWLLYRYQPSTSTEDRVILWVREDIYLLATDEPSAIP